MENQNKPLGFHRECAACGRLITHEPLGRITFEGYPVSLCGGVNKTGKRIPGCRDMRPMVAENAIRRRIADGTYQVASRVGQK